MKRTKQKKDLSPYFVSKQGNLCVYATAGNVRLSGLYKVTGIVEEEFNHTEVR